MWGAANLPEKVLRNTGFSQRWYFLRAQKIEKNKIRFKFSISLEIFGHPQTCVYVSGKVPLSGQGEGADAKCMCPFRPTDSLGRKGQIHCVSTRPLVSREGSYQIHGQSLNTHWGKHRSGGAQKFQARLKCSILTSRTPHTKSGGLVGGSLENSNPRGRS